MNKLHRIRTPFVLVNALLMVLFGLGALAAPEPLWELAGVEVEASGVVRLMGWYLFVFGVGGLQDWIEDRHIGVHFIDPGSPWQNGHNKSFNGVFRETHAEQPGAVCGYRYRWNFQPI